MRVFVTGATGFIGSYLVPLLISRGHQVAVLSRSPFLAPTNGVTVIAGDLQNIDAWQNQLKEFAPDAAVHLAWLGLPDYGAQLCVKNLNFGIQLYQALLAIGCQKIITTGTCWEYGSLTGRVSVNDHPAMTNLFAATKTGLRLIGSAMAQEKNAAFIWARLFFVYGAGQRQTSLIPTMITQGCSGQSPQVRNPMAANDFVYVQDVAEALLALISANACPPLVNIGSGQATYVSDVAELVFSSIQRGKTEPPAFKNVPKDHPSAFWADLSEMRDLGWQPRYDLYRGIQETVKTLLDQTHHDLKKEVV